MPSNAAISARWLAFLALGTELVEAPWPAGPALSLRRLANSGGGCPFGGAAIREDLSAADVRRCSLTEIPLDLARPRTARRSSVDGQGVPRRDHGRGRGRRRQGELVHASQLSVRLSQDQARRSASAGACGFRYGGGDLVGGPVHRGTSRCSPEPRGGGRLRQPSPTKVEKAAIAFGLVHEASALGYPDDELAGHRPHRPSDRSGRDESWAFLERPAPNFMRHRRVATGATNCAQPNSGSTTETSLGQELASAAIDPIHPQVRR